MKRILFLTFLLFAAKANAQSWDKVTVENLLCREWRIERMVMDSEEDTPEEGNDYIMTFQADHKVTATDEDEPADWSYGEPARTLTMKFPYDEEPMVMEIKELSEDKLMLEASEDGALLQIYLVATKK